MTATPVIPRPGPPLVHDAPGRLRQRPDVSPRLAWVDFARGLVVLLVVLMHVDQYHYLPLIQGENPQAYAFWTQVGAVLEGVRMPALLVLSGWLASNQIREGLGDRRTRKRLATNAYLYALWLALYAGLTWLLDAGSVAQAVTPDQYLGQLLLPYSTLWFLAALVWYTLFFAALRRLPGPVALAIAFGISAWSATFLSIDLGLWVRIPQYLLFFGLGVHGKLLWGRIAARPWPALAGAVSLGIVSWGAGYELDAQRLWSLPAQYLGSLAGVAAVLAIASLITRARVPGSGLVTWVGRRTVSVYVLHYPALMFLTVAASGPAFDWPRTLMARSLTGWLYPALLTAGIAAAAVGVHLAAERIGLAWLFRLPRLDGPGRGVWSARSWRSGLQAAVVQRLPV